MGDHANLPYGEKSQDEIIKMTCEGVTQLIALGCTVIFIACNTASILAAPFVRNRFDKGGAIKIFDISSSTIGFLESNFFEKSHATVSDEYNIGVFATLATVKSGYFSEEIEKLGNLKVQQVICHQLVDLIENSASIDVIRRCVHFYVDELKKKFDGKNPRIVILGCTHYSLVKDIFVEALGDGCNIVNQEVLMLSCIDVNAFLLKTSKTPFRRVLTTGNVIKSNMAAKFLLGENNFNFVHI